MFFAGQFIGRVMWFYKFLISLILLVYDCGLIHKDIKISDIQLDIE